MKTDRAHLGSDLRQVFAGEAACRIDSLIHWREVPGNGPTPDLGRTALLLENRPSGQCSLKPDRSVDPGSVEYASCTLLDACDRTRPSQVRRLRKGGICFTFCFSRSGGEKRGEKIVYKGLLDLQANGSFTSPISPNSRIKKAAIVLVHSRFGTNTLGEAWEIFIRASFTRTCVHNRRKNQQTLRGELKPERADGAKPPFAIFERLADD